MTGQGDVEAVPDQATLSAGVVSREATANAALDANRQTMNAIFAALQKAGIPDRAIRTSQFAVSPVYEETPKPNSGPRIAAYQVTNSVTIAVDDLAKLGPDIDALVGTGANSMGGIAFSIHDPKPLLREARETAIHDAMDKARTYAKAAGVTLGRILSIGEGGGAAPTPMFRAMAGLAATPIAAGEQTVSADVSVTFEIR